MARPTPRRSLVALGAAALVLSACGGDDTTDGPVVDDQIDTPVDESTSDAASDSDDSDDADSGGADETTDNAASDGSDGAAGSAAFATKPDVEIPDEVPTELVVTDLISGSGPEAAAGDTVTVFYVGVRSEDGVEFDNNYDTGQPFPLLLGTNGVIQGWEQGLLGVQTGTRRQLDIPPELAYGDQAAGDVIRPGEALTFVVDVVEVAKRPEITAPPRADASECPETDGSEPQQREFDEMQPFCIDAEATYSAEVETNFGSFTIELDPTQAPIAVNNFVTLARYGYFDDTECHRVLTDFVVQCGDPDASGFGGPGYAIPDELPLPGEYELGSIAMANAGPDSAGSQFFIISGPRGTALPPQYTLFGQVVENFDPVIVELNTLENPDGQNGTPPLETIEIRSVTIDGP